MSINRTITATTTIPLLNASEGRPSSWAVQFIGSDTPSYSIVVQKRTTVPTGVTAGTYVPGHYVLDLTGAVTSGGSAIVVTTTATNIRIPSDGCDVALVCTKTTGTLAVNANPITE